MKKMNKKGFTIVELVIVIAVIAILAAVLIPTFSGIVTKANQSADLQEVKNAYTVYLADTLHANGTPAAKIKVAFTGYWVAIDNGQAKIVTADPGNDYAAYTVDTSGTDAKLAPVQP